VYKCVVLGHSANRAVPPDPRLDRGVKFDAIEDVDLKTAPWLESLESDPESVHNAGVAYATEQCRDLLANGCEGIHFYTLNRSKATVQIVKALNPKHAF